MDPTITKSSTGNERLVAADADASKKRNLLLVGGYAGNPVEVCGEDNDDAKI